MKEIVKYSNKMHNFPLKGFTQNELNFFYVICSQIKDRGADLIELDFDTIKSLSDYKPTSNARFVEDLGHINEKLMKCSGRLETEEEIVYFNLFSTFRVLKTRPVLKIRVNVDFLDFFNDIAREFTSFELKQYVSLDGVYSKSLFRILNQWKRNGATKKYSVSEMIELLGTPDYKPMKLKQKIIDPAVKEIRQKKAFANLWCEVIYAKKRGKPVEGYIFHFGKNDIEGQISIETLENGKYMPDTKEPSKKTSSKPKKNNFNNFEGRKYSQRYFQLLEKQAIGFLTDEEKAELELEIAKANSR